MNYIWAGKDMLLFEILVRGDRVTKEIAKVMRHNQQSIISLNLLNEILQMVSSLPS